MIEGVCLRLNPAKVGFQIDQNQMIFNIQNPSVSETGIMEGDKIVNIENFPYAPNAPEMLTLSPSQEIKISVIRPGVGRITKTIKMIVNEPTYLNYADALVWKDKSQIEEEGKQFIMGEGAK